MPWSNQGGGPWGSGGGGSKGPWGSGPQSSGPTPPDLEELLRRGQDKLKTVLPGGNLGGPLPFLLRFRENFGVHMSVADMPEHHEFVAKILGEYAAIDRKNIAVAFQGDRIVGGQHKESPAAQALVDSFG